MPGFATDSESEDDYVNGVVPERRAVVNLKGGIRRDNLETGVDFEIEDLENFENQEAPLDEPDDEYLSEICSEFNPSRMASLSMHDEGDESRTTFEILKEKMTDITGKFSSEHSNLIFKRVLEEASEDDPPINNGLVTIHYSAYLEGQDEPFDSTKRRRIPHTFRIGDSTTLEGLECGVRTMRVNERSQFIVNPVLGYGLKGVPKLVPENSEVLFDVTAIKCVGGDAIEELEHNGFSMDAEDNTKSFKLRVRAAKEEMAMGFTYFKEKKYVDASRHYLRAKNYITDVTVADEKEDDDRIRLYVKICRNNARSLFQLAKYGPCLRECQEVIGFFPNDPVSNHLKGQCLELHPGKQNVAGAIRAYRSGLQGRSSSVTLNEALNKALAKQREEAERSRTSGAEAVYRQGMAKMFGHRPTSNKSSQPGQSSLRKNPKYNQLCEEWRFRIDKKVKEVSDGQRDLVTFPIFELVELEVDYIRSAVEDSGLSFQERGSGLDSTVCVFKKS